MTPEQINERTSKTNALLEDIAALNKATKLEDIPHRLRDEALQTIKRTLIACMEAEIFRLYQIPKPSRQPWEGIPFNERSTAQPHVFPQLPLTNEQLPSPSGTIWCNGVPALNPLYEGERVSCSS